MKVCIVGISGKLGRYMLQHCLDRGHEVVGVCREQSVAKLDEFAGRITLVPGATDDPAVIARAVAGCDGVLTVLVPWGVHGYSSGTAQAVLDHAEPGARLIFSCGWHISRDGRDRYSRTLRWTLAVVTPVARWLRFVDIDDQVEACRRVLLLFRTGSPTWRLHTGRPSLGPSSRSLPRTTVHCASLAKMRRAASIWSSISSMPVRRPSQRPTDSWILIEREYLSWPSMVICQPQEKMSRAPGSA